jgi:hypothetical protein
MLRLLNPQGIAGLIASAALAVLLVIQKGETSHWRARAQFEKAQAAVDNNASPVARSGARQRALTSGENR